MFLTEEQATERLKSENNLANKFSRKESENIQEITIKSPGKNRTNLDEETRTEIATRARLGESQKQIARAFDITQGEVSHIKTGRVTGIDEEKVQESINQVRDLALERLMTSLGFLTNDKLSGCSAKDLSVIASNMGRVIEKTGPKESKDNINLVIYAPEIRQELSFNKIEV